MRLVNFIHERNMGKKFFFLTRDPIEDCKRFDYISSWAEPTKRYNVIHLLTHDVTANYKRQIGRSSAHNPNFNYIYSFSVPLNLFDYRKDHDRKHLWKNAGKSDEDERSFYEWLDRKEVKMALDSLVDLDKMIRHFDGFIDPVHNDPVVFYDAVKSKVVLVDGNMKRFKERGTGGIEVDVLPSDVRDELLRYTDKAGRRIDKSVKEWLKKNAPKRDKVLWRGMSQQFDDWGDYGKVTVEQVEKVLQRQVGLRSLTDVRRGAKAKLKRGKESSWSTRPEIAREFGSGMAMGSIGYLFRTRAKAADIVVDFTELPAEATVGFKFTNQNEVVVDTGTIDAEIVGLWASEAFIRWLREKGFAFDTKRGITRQ
jgi:hypothetical protein